MTAFCLLRPDHDLSLPEDALLTFFSFAAFCLPLSCNTPSSFAFICLWDPSLLRVAFLPRAQNRTLALCSKETVVGRPYHPVHDGQLSSVLSSLQMALLAAFLLCVPLQSSGSPSFQASALGPQCITLQSFNLPCLRPPPPAHGHHGFLELTPFDLV
ncbi:hypothetical protein GOP47_0002321 [Adiantum capillus-veneris]|uniref:Uncharacterized protein n=1 Tax=Adiantum capillus-veneris TaxID=13818 RepID=A0A9D4VBI8_ADICA|nr:hypothetical protein GOP47_0002321 [Adiantum capillus-veneris]